MQTHSNNDNNAEHLVVGWSIKESALNHTERKSAMTSRTKRERERERKETERTKVDRRGVEVQVVVVYPSAVGGVYQPDLLWMCTRLLKDC